MEMKFGKECESSTGASSWCIGSRGHESSHSSLEGSKRTPGAAQAHTRPKLLLSFQNMGKKESKRFRSDRHSQDGGSAESAWQHSS